MEDKILYYVQVQEGLSEEQCEIVRYGLSVLWHNVTMLLSLFILGFVSGTWQETIVFALCMVLIRRKSGGYHADTRVKCVFLTCLLWGLVVTISFFLTACGFRNWEAVVVLFLILNGIVWHLAPVEHPNKPLTEALKRKNKVLSIVWMVLFEALCFLFCSNIPRVSYGIAGSLCEVTILMCWGKGGEYLMRLAKIVVKVAEKSAKSAVQQSSDWWHYQEKEPESVRRWAETENKKYKNNR